MRKTLRIGKSLTSAAGDWNQRVIRDLNSGHSKRRQERAARVLIDRVDACGAPSAVVSVLSAGTQAQQATLRSHPDVVFAIVE